MFRSGERAKPNKRLAGPLLDGQTSYRQANCTTGLLRVSIVNPCENEAICYILQIFLVAYLPAVPLQQILELER